MSKTVEYATTEDLGSMTVEILTDVQAKIHHSRSETLARLDSLEASIPKDQSQALSVLANMRASLHEFDVSIAEIDKLIVSLGNEAH